MTITLESEQSGPAVSHTLMVFDPPQCCATGVCGPDVDPALVQFASDLKQLSASGVLVQRFNLAQQPEAFMQQPLVVDAVNTVGTAALPLIIVDGKEISRGRYPSSSELQSFVSEAQHTFMELGVEQGAPCCDPSDSSCC